MTEEKSEIRMTEIRTSKPLHGSGLRPFMRACSAFTLMEMLLALAISAIVVAGIGGVFYSAVRLRETTAAALDEAAPVQHALAFIRRDLRGALPPSGYLAGDFKSGTASGGLGQSAGVGLQV